MRLLAFSDVHRNDRTARKLADMAADADVVVAAGDFADLHIGLDKLIDMLVVIDRIGPTRVYNVGPEGTFIEV